MDNSRRALTTEHRGVFKVNQATMSYEILAGKDKDYYLSCSTQALRQNLTIFNKVLLGDDFEEQGRQNLRTQRNNNPTRKALAAELNKMLRPLFEEMCKRIVDSNKQPEEWIPLLREELKNALAH